MTINYLIVGSNCHDFITQDALREKLWLKNSSLRVRRNKLFTQLKHKEEAGEVRHEVDFEQLKIENKQFNERFEDKNQELLNLKVSAGNALQVLNVYKVQTTGLLVSIAILSSKSSLISAAFFHCLCG